MIWQGDYLDTFKEAILQMFIPAEPILSAAFEHEPSLQEYAFNKHVLINT